MAIIDWAKEGSSITDTSGLFDSLSSVLDVRPALGKARQPKSKKEETEDFLKLVPLSVEEAGFQQDPTPSKWEPKIPYQKWRGDETFKDWGFYFGDFKRYYSIDGTWANAHIKDAWYTEEFRYYDRDEKVYKDFVPVDYPNPEEVYKAYANGLGEFQEVYLDALKVIAVGVVSPLAVSALIEVGVVGLAAEQALVYSKFLRQYGNLLYKAFSNYLYKCLQTKLADATGAATWEAYKNIQLDEKLDFYDISTEFFSTLITPDISGSVFKKILIEATIDGIKSYFKACYDMNRLPNISTSDEEQAIYKGLLDAASSAFKNSLKVPLGKLALPQSVIDKMVDAAAKLLIDYMLELEVKAIMDKLFPKK